MMTRFGCADKMDTFLRNRLKLRDKSIGGLGAAAWMGIKIDSNPFSRWTFFLLLTLAFLSLDQMAQASLSPAHNRRSSFPVGLSSADDAFSPPVDDNRQSAFANRFLIEWARIERFNFISIVCAHQLKPFFRLLHSIYDVYRGEHEKKAFHFFTLFTMIILPIFVSLIFKW